MSVGYRRRHRQPGNTIDGYLDVLRHAYQPLEGGIPVDDMPRRKSAPLPPPPTAAELARDELAARLRNIETLCDEVRGLVDAAEDDATEGLLRRLCDTVAAQEAALAHAVEDMAERCGLVAVAP